ncbi:hypothetical protein D3C78_1390150 [compost metagenome]
MPAFEAKPRELSAGLMLLHHNALACSASSLLDYLRFQGIHVSNCAQRLHGARFVDWLPEHRIEVYNIHAFIRQGAKVVQMVGAAHLNSPHSVIHVRESCIIARQALAYERTKHGLALDSRYPSFGTRSIRENERI